MLGYVPTLLVVWSEASQHWSLQAVGWSQILDTMSPARCQPLDKYSCICFPPAFMSLKKSHKYPLPPPETFQNQQGRSGPGSYEVIALALGPVYMRPCVHPPRVESLFPPVLSSFWDLLAFKAKCSRGSSSWCYTPRMRRLARGSELSLPRENFWDIIILQFVGCPPPPMRGVGINYIASVSFLLSLWHILCRGT